MKPNKVQRIASDLLNLFGGIASFGGGGNYVDGYMAVPTWLAVCICAIGPIAIIGIILFLIRYL